MDASFLNFHQEETFQAFHSTSYYLDDLYSDLNDQNYGWESERDDMGGTPPSEGTGGLSDRSASPQHVEIDNMLLLEKWTQHISSLEIPSVSDLSDVCESIQTADAQEVLNSNVFCDKLLEKDTLDLSDPIGHLVDSDFDITKYVNEPDKTEEVVGNSKDFPPDKPGGKKIDMKNCRYIVKDELESEEDVDVETLSECEDVKIDFVKKELSKKELSKVDSFKVEDKTTEVTSFDIGSSVMQAGDLVSLLEEFEATETKTVQSNPVRKIESNVRVLPKAKGKKIKKKLEEKTRFVKVKDKQIPPKHIKVKEKVKNVGKSCKIQVSKKVIEKKTGEIQKLKNVKSIKDNNEISHKVNLNSPKQEEKKYRIIKEIPVVQPEYLAKVNVKKCVRKEVKKENQLGLKKVHQLIPTVNNKTINEKLIKTDIINLGTEQAKQSINSIRLDHDYCISIHPKNTNNSVLRNQPTVKTADGKLMVSLLKVNTIKTVDTKKKLNLEEYKKRRQNRLGVVDKKTITTDKCWGLDPYPKLPKNLEMKTFVSIGVNTDQTWAKVQEITKGNSVNFSPNSLIASMVERLPGANEAQPQLAENKTIVYLDKNRPKKETCNKRVQTDIVRRRSRLSSSSSCSSRSSRSSSRSVSPANRKRRRTSSERIREVEERRVIYVGRIANGTTQEDLRRRFYRFGPINYVSVHFRRKGDNYGFVTFRYKEDAYEAVEHGNEDPSLPRYDLSFGGRRVFCKTSYADLDDVRDDYVAHPADPSGGTFEDLLRDFQAKVRSKKIRSS